MCLDLYENKFDFYWFLKDKNDTGGRGLDILNGIPLSTTLENFTKFLFFLYVIASPTLLYSALGAKKCKNVQNSCLKWLNPFLCETETA